jgi:hypothetical protein
MGELEVVIAVTVAVVLLTWFFVPRNERFLDPAPKPGAGIPQMWSSARQRIGDAARMSLAAVDARLRIKDRLCRALA